MSYQKDKVSDVIAVLAVMRKEFGRRPRNTSELRKEAVTDVAETGLRAGRFLNQDSASKSIHDACARRLGLTITAFDRIADRWLRQNSNGLKDTLIRHSDGSSQRVAVISFFGDNA
jgi:hypothetical protein